MMARTSGFSVTMRTSSMRVSMASATKPTNEDLRGSRASSPVSLAHDVFFLHLVLREARTLQAGDFPTFQGFGDQSASKSTSSNRSSQKGQRPTRSCAPSRCGSRSTTAARISRPDSPCSGRSAACRPSVPNTCRSSRCGPCACGRQGWVRGGPPRCACPVARAPPTFRRRGRRLRRSPLPRLDSVSSTLTSSQRE